MWVRRWNRSRRPTRKEAGIESSPVNAGSREANGLLSCFDEKDCNLNDSVLDVGCGSLSTGRHLLRFLDPGHYWGFDTNHALILAGVSMELPRLDVPAERGFYLFNQEFDLSGAPEGFQFAISEGLFSRLPLEQHCPLHCRGNEATRAGRPLLCHLVRKSRFPWFRSDRSRRVYDLPGCRALPLPFRNVNEHLRCRWSTRRAS